MISRRSGLGTSARWWSWPVQLMERIDQDSTEQDFDRILENVVLFARLLRRAGMTLGTGQILDFTRALEIIDIGNRDDVYHTARVILVGRREDLIEIGRAHV